MSVVPLSSRASASSLAWRQLPARGRAQAIRPASRATAGLGVRPYTQETGNGVQRSRAADVGLNGRTAQTSTGLPALLASAARMTRRNGVLGYAVLQQQRNAYGMPAYPSPLARSFHASSRQQGLPVLVAAGMLLKSTAAIGAVTTIARVVFTLLPFQIFMRWQWAKSIRRHAMKYPQDVSEAAIAFFEKHCMGEWIERANTKGMKCTPEQEKRVIKECQVESMRRTGLVPEEHEDLLYKGEIGRHFRAIGWILIPLGEEAQVALQELSTKDRRDLYRVRRFEAKQRFFNYKTKLIGRVIFAFVALPLLLVLITGLVSLERVPYTGRLRMIMLSPDEEDVITSRLAGPGWFAAVINLLTTPEAPAPRVVPIDDWRWRWVNDVMRRLETSVVASCHDTKAVGGRDVAPDHAYINGKKVPLAFPPPPDPAYPLHPRARAAASLHNALPGGDPEAPSHHRSIGPPYSLLLLEKDEENALSYGFGQNGAGGIVVFTGMLDQILATNGAGDPTDDLHATRPPPPPTFMQSLFGARASPSPAPAQRGIPRPTEKQDLQLATVLAHELAHLLLSHHLEAISSTKVLIPSMLSIFTDMARAAIFPITFFFGPFVNDAIANVSKTGVNEWALIGDYQFSKLHEKEADIVALRILAYAGYDAKEAVDAWSDIARQTCQPDDPVETKTTIVYKPTTWAMFRGGVHATPEARYEAAKKELERWEEIAQKALRGEREVIGRGA